MDLMANLAHGLGVALTFNNLLFCLIGCIIGTAIGVLPGIGPVATISLLLPITFGQPATTAIIMPSSSTTKSFRLGYLSGDFLENIRLGSLIDFTYGWGHI